MGTPSWVHIVGFTWILIIGCRFFYVLGYIRAKKRFKMAELSYNLDRKSVTCVINTLRSRKRHLSKKNAEFIDDMHQHYIIENKWMSDGQKKYLSDLWEKHG